jgi:hypothetical protein
MVFVAPSDAGDRGGWVACGSLFILRQIDRTTF